MFEQEKAENYFKRIAGALGVLPRRYTILLLSAVVLLTPYSTTVVPEWKVRVLGPDGKPAAGVLVRQAWKNYSLELDVGENFDERLSDENGYAVFPRKTITKGPLHRGVLMFVTGLLTLAHGSTGIHASVWAVTNKCSSTFIDYHPSRPLPDTLVLSCAD
jgi:hypothetical protein